MASNKNIMWSRKQMRPKSIKRGGKYQGVLGQIMSNKKIAAALDRESERKTFNTLLHGLGKDNVKKEAVRKLFGDLRSGRIVNKDLSQKEIRTIAKELFPDISRRYSFRSENPTKEIFNKSSQSVAAAGKKTEQATTQTLSEKFSAIRNKTNATPAKPQNIAKAPSALVAAKISSSPNKSKPDQKTKPDLRQAAALNVKLADAAAPVGLVSALPKNKKEKSQKTEKAAFGEPTLTATEEKRKEAIKKLHSSQNIDYEFVKTGLVSDLKSGEKTKDDQAAENISLNDNSPGSRRRMAEVMNKIREMEDSDDSGKPTGGFSNAMSATTRNKK